MLCLPPGGSNCPVLIEIKGNKHHSPFLSIFIFIFASSCTSETLVLVEGECCFISSESVWNKQRRVASAGLWENRSHAIQKLHGQKNDSHLLGGDGDSGGGRRLRQAATELSLTACTPRNPIILFIHGTVTFD